MYIASGFQEVYQNINGNEQGTKVIYNYDSRTGDKINVRVGRLGSDIIEERQLSLDKHRLNQLLGTPNKPKKRRRKTKRKRRRNKKSRRKTRSKH
jgi:hypothetical protein